jgi:Exonuclease/ATP-dependent DNA helicase RecG C-terminal
VDVPDSSMCIIDKADQFGISQLHQIRGRIGRGTKPPTEVLEECFCVLLFDDEPSEQAQVKADSTSTSPLVPITRPVPLKLEILSKTNDGFEIAEKDLELRGPGAFFGAQQSGLKFSGLRAGNFLIHSDLLKDAHSVASSIYNNTYPLKVKDKEIQNLLAIFRSPTGAPTATASTSKTIKSKSVKTEITKSGILRPETTGNFVDFTVLDGPESPAIILFDLETTGLEAQSNYIIQFAAKLMDENNNSNGECKMFNQYVNPNVVIPRMITELTGITREKLTKHGKPFSTVWREFSLWLKEVSKAGINGGGRPRPIVLMAHNLIGFDLPFLDLEIRRHDRLRGEHWIEDNNISCFVDSLPLLRSNSVWTERTAILKLPKNTPSQPERFKLGLVYKFIFQKEIANAHDAAGDILALGEILESEGMKTIWKKHANKLQTKTFNRKTLKLI